MSLTQPPERFDFGHHGKLLRLGRRVCTEDTRRSKHLGTPSGLRREERATGKDVIALEIFLHWYLCGKPIIPIPLKRLGQ